MVKVLKKGNFYGKLEKYWTVEVLGKGTFTVKG